MCAKYGHDDINYKFVDIKLNSLLNTTQTLLSHFFAVTTDCSHESVHEPKLKYQSIALYNISINDLKRQPVEGLNQSTCAM